MLSASVPVGPRTSLAPLTAAAAGLLARLHDRGLGEHALAVGGRAIMVCQQLGLDEAETARTVRAAFFHDAGKLEIPDRVLNRPGPLEPEEWQLMRTHPERSERLVSGVPELADVAPLVRHHHERWDGGGYPDGLAGEAIPLASRIVFACDAFDAMTAVRSYRPTLSTSEALQEIRAGAGSQFDPTVGAALTMTLSNSTRFARPTSVRRS